MSRPKDVPVNRIIINNPGDKPKDVGRTPGGTLYGTTPGGTRIIYERQTMLDMRLSPHSRSPPANMAVIPGVTFMTKKIAESVNSEEPSPFNDIKFDDQFSLDEDFVN